VSSVFWGSAQRGRKMDAAEVARLRDAPGKTQAPRDSTRNIRRTLSEDLAGARMGSLGSASASGSSPSTRSASGNSAGTSSTCGGRWSCPFGSCHSLPAVAPSGNAAARGGEEGDSREGTGREQGTQSGSWAWLHSSGEATLSEGCKWAHAAAQAASQSAQGAWHEAHSSLLWLRAPRPVLLQLLLSLLLLLTPTGLLPGVPQGLRFLLSLSLLSLLLIPSSLFLPGYSKPDTAAGTTLGGSLTASVFDIHFPSQSQGEEEWSDPGRPFCGWREPGWRCRGGAHRFTDAEGGTPLLLVPRWSPLWQGTGLWEPTGIPGPC